VKVNKKELGKFKQEILRINNEVNQELYDFGLIWQKVDILGNRISILAKNRRIHALAKIDDKSYFTTRLMDLALLNEFKLKLKEKFEENFPEYPIKSVMKDYDSKAELAATFIILEEDVTE
jgi:hypothetical protein